MLTIGEARRVTMAFAATCREVSRWYAVHGLTLDAVETKEREGAEPALILSQLWGRLADCAAALAGDRDALARIRDMEDEPKPRVGVPWDRHGP